MKRYLFSLRGITASALQQSKVLPTNYIRGAWREGRFVFRYTRAGHILLATFHTPLKTSHNRTDSLLSKKDEVLLTKSFD